MELIQRQDRTESENLHCEESLILQELVNFLSLSWPIPSKDRKVNMTKSA